MNCFPHSHNFHYTLWGEIFYVIDKPIDWIYHFRNAFWAVFFKFRTKRILYLLLFWFRKVLINEHFSVIFEITFQQNWFESRLVHYLDDANGMFSCNLHQKYPPHSHYWINFFHNNYFHTKLFKSDLTSRPIKIETWAYTRIS